MSREPRVLREGQRFARPQTPSPVGPDSGWAPAARRLLYRPNPGDFYPALRDTSSPIRLVYKSFAIVLRQKSGAIPLCANQAPSLGQGCGAVELNPMRLRGALPMRRSIRRAFIYPAG